MPKQYMLIISRGQRINTYRSGNLKSLIEDIINDILWSYTFEPEAISSKDFDFDEFRYMFDLNYSEATALKELVEFKEKIDDLEIELNETIDYQFSEPNNKWSLKFEKIYEGTSIVTGHTIVDSMYPTNFHIEQL
jgi:hypothetical protein